MDWTRGHTIGRGSSSAAVSIATSHRSGDIFAVKSAELSESEFLQREQRILSTLSSPRVVGYIGNEVTKENNKLMYNLLMEYAPGGTLTNAIRRHGGRIDESMIGYYTRQIVQGLEYLHSSGVAHCDIKGQNILIGESGAKLADFGCAKWVNAAAAGTSKLGATVGGTPVFMAPEVARGEEQGFPADIWALGCTVIEMATGGSPWSNVTDPVSVLYRIAFSGELPGFPDFLSDEARDFLTKCLKTDPKDRWSAKKLIKHPFLTETDAQGKKNLEFNSNSPTSILDQGAWNSIQGPETLDVMTPTSCPNSPPAKRIRQLSSCSGGSGWAWNENWITIRSTNNDQGREFIEDAFFGSGTAPIANYRFHR